MPRRVVRVAFLAALALACVLALAALRPAAGAATSAALPPAVVEIVETVGVADAGAAVPPAGVTVTESATVSDIARVIPPLQIDVNEHIEVSEAQAVIPPAVVLVDEQVSVSDGQRILPPAVIAVSETVGVTETSTARPPVIVSITETVTVTDAHRLIAPVSISISESVVVTDAVAFNITATDTLTLTPGVATNVVGTEHCVTATIKNAFGNPVSGVTVRFNVSGSVTTSGAATTNGSGEATFCYKGPELPGRDTITAYADSDGDSVRDPGEASGAATKTWSVPASTPLCQVTITNGRITANNGDKATFSGTAQVAKSGQPKGNEGYQDHGPAANVNVKSTTIMAVVCRADKKQASIYGQATINGSGSYLFKIDVTDLAEPGGKDTYRILVSGGYDSGQHALEGGNIQIKIG